MDFTMFTDGMDALFSSARLWDCIKTLRIEPTTSSMTSEHSEGMGSVENLSGGFSFGPPFFSKKALY